MTTQTDTNENKPEATPVNVDSAEIAKFEALARRWWDLEGEFRPLHDINPLRLNYIEKKVPLAEQKLLDVGCGGGILSEGMSHRGAIVTGIDMGEAPLQVARLHAMETGLDIDYLKVTVEEYAESHAGEFDIVTCLEMLEHVPSPESVISSCRKLLKPGGNLFLSTINRNPKAYLSAIIGAEYVLKLLPKGTHDFAKLIRPSELARWIRQSGFELLDITGMAFNPITQRYRLTPTSDVNYLVHASVPID